MTFLVRRVLLGVVVWVVASIVVGVAAGRIPERRLTSDSWLTRLRNWELGPDVYKRRLRMHRWKDALPESNSLGGGDRPSKSSIVGRADVARLVIETRRAEYVHWSLVAFGFTFLLWNPLWLGATHVVVGAAWNAPFIAVQRYNRSRVRRSARAADPPERPT